MSFIADKWDDLKERVEEDKDLLKPGPWAAFGPGGAAVYGVNRLLGGSKMPSAGSMLEKTGQALMLGNDYVAQPVLGEIVSRGVDPTPLLYGAANIPMAAHDALRQNVSNLRDTEPPEPMRKTWTHGVSDEQRERLNEIGKDDSLSPVERRREIWKTVMEGRPVDRFLMETVTDPLSWVGVGRAGKLPAVARAAEARAAGTASRGQRLLHETATGFDAVGEAINRVFALPLTAGAHGARRLGQLLPRGARGQAGRELGQESKALDRIGLERVIPTEYTDPSRGRYTQQTRHALGRLIVNLDEGIPNSKSEMWRAVRQAEPLERLRAWNELQVRKSARLSTEGVQPARYDDLGVLQKPEQHFYDVEDRLAKELVNDGFLRRTTNGQYEETSKHLAHWFLDNRHSVIDVPAELRRAEHEALDRAAQLLPENRQHRVYDDFVESVLAERGDNNIFPSWNWRWYHDVESYVANRLPDVVEQNAGRRLRQHLQDRYGAEVIPPEIRETLREVTPHVYLRHLRQTLRPGESAYQIDASDPLNIVEDVAASIARREAPDTLYRRLRQVPEDALTTARETVEAVIEQTTGRPRQRAMMALRRLNRAQSQTRLTKEQINEQLTRLNLEAIAPEDFRGYDSFTIRAAQLDDDALGEGIRRLEGMSSRTPSQEQALDILRNTEEVRAGTSGAGLEGLMRSLPDNPTIVERELVTAGQTPPPGSAPSQSLPAGGTASPITDTSPDGVIREINQVLNTQNLRDRRVYDARLGRKLRLLPEQALDDAITAAQEGVQQGTGFRNRERAVLRRLEEARTAIRNPSTPEQVTTFVDEMTRASGSPGGMAAFGNRTRRAQYATDGELTGGIERLRAVDSRSTEQNAALRAMEREEARRQGVATLGPDPAEFQRTQQGDQLPLSQEAPSEGSTPHTTFRFTESGREAFLETTINKSGLGVDENTIYRAHDSVSDTFRKRAIELDAPVENAQRVTAALEPIIVKNAGHFTASEAVMGAMRSEMDAALRETDPRRQAEILARGLEKVNLEQEAYGLRHPAISRFFDLIPEPRIREEMKATVAGPRSQEGSLLPPHLAPAWDRLMSKPEVVAAKRQHGKDIASLRRIWDQVREFYPEAGLDSFGSHQELVEAIGKYGTREEVDEVARVLDKWGIPGTTEAMGKWQASMLDASFRNLRKVRQGADEKELNRLIKELDWMTKAFREQALLTPRYTVVNVMDMTFKSLIEGVNPLVVLSANKRFRQYGVDLQPFGIESYYQRQMAPEEFAVGEFGTRTRVRGETPMESFKEMFLRPLKEDLQNPARRQAARDRAALGRIRGIGAVAGPLADFNRSLNMAIETSFREAATVAGMERHLKRRAWRPFLNQVEEDGNKVYGLSKQQTGSILADMERTDGVISADNVRAVIHRHAPEATDFSTDMSRRWSANVGEALNVGTDMANQVHFRYGDTFEIEEKLQLRRVLAFHVWATRNVPYYTGALAENPWLLRSIFRFGDVTADEAERHNLSTLEWHAEMGPMARTPVAWLFGTPNATAFINPLVVISIMDQMKPRRVDEDQSPVGQALGQVERLGLLPLPWIREPLNVMGLLGDEQPQRLSRHSQVTFDTLESLGMSPDTRDIIDIERSAWQPLIRWAREPVSGAIPGVEQQSSASITGDQYLDWRIATELIHESLREFGYVHPHFVAAMADTDNELHRSAREKVVNRDMRRGIYSMLWNMPIRTLSEEEAFIRQRQQEVDELPYDEQQALRDAGDIAFAYTERRFDRDEAQIRAAQSLLGLYGWDQPPATMEWIYDAFPEYRSYNEWRQTQPEGADTSAAAYLRKDWWLEFMGAQREIPDLSHDEFFHFRDVQRDDPDVDLLEFVSRLRQYREENRPEIEYIQPDPQPRQEPQYIH